MTHSIANCVHVADKSNFNFIVVRFGWMKLM